MNLLQVIGVLIAAWVFHAFLVRSTEQRERLSRLERKVDALLSQQGLQDAWRPLPSARVSECIASGRKIEAIKVYRDENPQLSMKEAKDTVEKMVASSQTTAV